MPRAFKGVGEYLSPSAGTYDLEVGSSMDASGAPEPMTLPVSGGAQNSLAALVLAGGVLLIVRGIGLRGRLVTVLANK